MPFISLSANARTSSCHTGPGRARVIVRHCVCAGVLALAAAASAEACTSAHPGGTTSVTIQTWDDTEADVVVGSWQYNGNASFLWNCGAGETPINVSAAMPDLEYVRNVIVDGETYPAFGVKGRPRTPLLVFQYIASDGSGTTFRFPFDVRTTLHFPGSGITGDARLSWMRMATISRGGLAESLPTTVLGTITYASPNFPALVKVDDYDVTANLRTKTCTLADKAVTLQDINLGDLPAAGSTAAEQGFNVVMTCNGQFPVDLMLTDATQPANTGSRLLPTPKATAQGVRVELLREGAPVVLGQTWTLPQSATGKQDIPVAARYYREAGTYLPGVVEGQAVLTASYR